MNIKYSTLWTLIALAVAGCTAAAPTPAPAATPMPPAARPESAAAAPTGTPVPLVWWQPELYRVRDAGSGKTYLMAPQQVVEQVIAHYDQAGDLAHIADLEVYRAALPRFYSGAMLEEQLAQAPEFVRYEIRPEGMARAHEVKEFSPDGLECTLGVRQQGGKVTLRERTSGETVEAFSNTLTVVRMHYDLDDGRWKGVELVDIVELGP